MVQLVAIPLRRSDSITICVVGRKNKKPSGWVRGGSDGCFMSKKSSKPKTMATLEQNECRWPIGDPREEGFHFCGEPQATGRPYCAHHWAMAFVPSRPRYQQPAPVVAPTRRAA
jgi:GcrA cell cycle regulator